MRKFLMAVAIGGLVLLVAAPAMALDFKFGAEYRVRFYDYSNTAFDRDNSISVQGGAEQPGAQQGRGNPRGVQLRIRPRFDVSDDNGNIQATIRFETGDTTFGAGGGANSSSMGSNGNYTIADPNGNRTGNNAGGSIGADGVSLEVKWGFVDFALPMNIPLRVRAGIQPWYLPKGLVIDDDAAGVRLYGNYGMVSYEAFWYRIATAPASASAIGNVIAPTGSGAAAITPGAVVTAAQAAANLQYITTATTGQARFDSTKDDNFDFWGVKANLDIAPWLNAGAWYMFGDNRANCANPNNVAYNVGGTEYISAGCPTQDRVRTQNWFGLDFFGKVATVDYDLDFVYGQAKGGGTGGFTSGTINGYGFGISPNGAAAAATPMNVAGWAIDGGVHIPIGPVKWNLLGTYASGDKQNGVGSNSNAFPIGPGPSWSGSGGQYELIGEGGAFDVDNMTQHSPTGLYMLGTTLEYVPVKALWLKAAYGFIGFSGKAANCATATYLAGVASAGAAPAQNGYQLAQTAGTQCYGPVYYGKPGDPIAGKGYLGQEFHLRADYTMWTGFKVQAMAGWLFPSAGDVAGKYILQFLYNF